MSKIYKSSNVSIGTPKSIVNVFKSNIKTAAAEVDAVESEDRKISAEAAADNIIEDAKQMYLKIIEEANSEAQRIKDTASAEAQRLMMVSREDGYREGAESGYNEARREAQTVIDEAAEIKEFLDSRRDDIFREAEEQVLQLVLDIAKKVMCDELTQNEEAILSLVKQALEKCAFKKKLVLKVSPQDSEFVMENKNRICMMVEGISDIDIVSDLSLDKGSCIIETPSGEVNSSIDVQIKEIEKIFTFILRNE